MSAGLKVGILVRIGDGRPTEVAQADVPLRAVLVKDDLGAHIEIDWETLNAEVRSALHGVADALPQFGPGAAS